MARGSNCIMTTQKLTKAAALAILAGAIGLTQSPAAGTI